jgi:hypothetical protein
VGGDRAVLGAHCILAATVFTVLRDMLDAVSGRVTEPAA